MIGCIKVENQTAKAVFIYYVYTNLLQIGIKTYSFVNRSTLVVNDDTRAYLSSALKKMTRN